MHTAFLFRSMPLFFLLFIHTGVKAQIPVTSKGTAVTSEVAQDTTKGDVYAIITGVSNYPGINPLKYADKDALLFRDFLLTASGGNTKPENILALINEGAKAADFNVKAYSWLLSKKLKKGDRLYIYFSGHGDAMNEDLYFFLPYDCAPNKDDHNYLGTGNINMHTVKTLFIKPLAAKGVEVLLILDACRTNELPGGKEGQQNFTNSFIAEQKMGDIMMLSTGAGQVSIESHDIGNGHGLFTWYLIDGLAGAADKDSLNGDNDGKISLAEIGSYVKTQVRRIARTNYNTVQIPYYCCAEKDLDIIAKVDNATFTAWENAKKLQLTNADQNLFAINARKADKGVDDLSLRDTMQISAYNQFVQAVRDGKLMGPSSAETLYNDLEKQWPSTSLTDDARFSLASEYINFCQQKINLFLAGKGLIHIMSLEKELGKDDNTEGSNIVFADFGEQIKKLKTLVTTGYDIAAVMMDKAVDMLKAEPELINPILPKRDFLKTMAAYADKRNKLKDVAVYCRKAIESDPASPSGYLLMGWIYQDMQNDSCEYYFKRAVAIAPKWAYPVNGLGNFYVSKNNTKEGMRYFFAAVGLDSLYSNAYRNIGLTYYNQKVFDSARYYLLKAIRTDSCDSYANEYYGSVMSEYLSPIFGSFGTDSVYFNISRRYFLRSVNCDKNYASGYQKLAALYSRTKNDDSALAILKRCTTINPENADGFRNLGSFYLNTLHDTTQAEAIFKKAISLDPFNGYNYYLLARIYKKQRNKDKAMEVYNEAWKRIGDNKDLFNELGNVYLQMPSDFEQAAFFYRRALQIDSTLDYVYYNLGLLHEAKGSVKDSSVYYYTKAVAYNPIRWQKQNHMLADFYFDTKNFTLAKAYYQQALTIVTTTRERDLIRLIGIFIDEKNFTAAQNTINLYLKPATDNSLFTRLTDTIKDAAGKN